MAAPADMTEAAEGLRAYAHRLRCDSQTAATVPGMTSPGWRRDVMEGLAARAAMLETLAARLEA